MSPPSQTSPIESGRIRSVPSRLRRYQQAKDLHFITFSCYGRKPKLGTPATRDLFRTLIGEGPPKVWSVCHRLCLDARACSFADQRAAADPAGSVSESRQADHFAQIKGRTGKVLAGTLLQQQCARGGGPHPGDPLHSSQPFREAWSRSLKTGHGRVSGTMRQECRERSRSSRNGLRSSVEIGCRKQ